MDAIRLGLSKIRTLSLSNNCQTLFLTNLPLLEELNLQHVQDAWIQDCVALTKITGASQYKKISLKRLPNLKEVLIEGSIDNLFLSGFNEIIKISAKQVKELEVVDMSRLKALPSCSGIEKLTVFYCSEIRSIDKGNEYKSVRLSDLSQLRGDLRLNLNRLDQLKNNEVSVSKCPLSSISCNGLVSKGSFSDLYLLVSMNVIFSEDSEVTILNCPSLRSFGFDIHSSPEEIQALRDFSKERNNLELLPKKLQYLKKIQNIQNILNEVSFCLTGEVCTVEKLKEFENEILQDSPLFSSVDLAIFMKEKDKDSAKKLIEIQKRLIEKPITTSLNLKIKGLCSIDDFFEIRKNTTKFLRISWDSRLALVSNGKKMGNQLLEKLKLSLIEEKGFQIQEEGNLLKNNNEPSQTYLVPEPFQRAQIFKASKADKKTLIDLLINPSYSLKSLVIPVGDGQDSFDLEQEETLFPDKRYSKNVPFKDLIIKYLVCGEKNGSLKLVGRMTLAQFAEFFYNDLNTFILNHGDIQFSDIISREEMEKIEKISNNKQITEEEKAQLAVLQDTLSKDQEKIEEFLTKGLSIIKEFAPMEQQNVRANNFYIYDRIYSKNINIRAQTEKPKATDGEYAGFYSWDNNDGYNFITDATDFDSIKFPQFLMEVLFFGKTEEAIQEKFSEILQKVGIKKAERE
jgi:hypothetical protein